MEDLLRGERAYRRWVGPQGALHARDYSRLRHWRPLCPGESLVVDVTTHRLRVVPAIDVRLASIKRLEPRARDLSVLDVKLAGGNRLRLWGEHVPELTVMLGWLLWSRVITASERCAGLQQRSEFGALR
jgi:hypothetical protein